MPRVIWIAVLIACLTGCTPAGDSPVEVGYRQVTDVEQLMNWILDPNADVIWGAAGAIITEAGTRDLAPTTQEG